MLKNKSIDYIFGMITGASLMLAFWACTNTPLGASGSTVQEVKVVNGSWNPVNVSVNIQLGMKNWRGGFSLTE